MATLDAVESPRPYLVALVREGIDTPSLTAHTTDRAARLYVDEQRAIPNSPRVFTATIHRSKHDVYLPVAIVAVCPFCWGTSNDEADAIRGCRSCR